MNTKKALIVVDAQYDFMPATQEEYEKKLGGALAVTDGDEIIPIVNELLEQFSLVIFTKDWHPAGMKAFASSYKTKKPFDKYKVNGEEDTLWPDHCIQNTRGADIHEAIDLSLINGEFYIFKKGMDKNNHPYSGFGAEGLEEFLNERGIEKLFICGLALDYCVKDTAIDSAMKGFETIVVIDATRPIAQDAEGLADTFISFMDAKVRVIESWEMPMYNFY